MSAIGIITMHVGVHVICAFILFIYCLWLLLKP